MEAGKNQLRRNEHLLVRDLGNQFFQPIAMSGNFSFREFYLRLFRRQPAGRRLRAQGGRLLIG